MISLPLLNEFFIGALILFTVLMMEKPRLHGLVRYFTLASLSLAGMMATIAAIRGAEHLYLAAAATFLIKGVLLPWLLLRTAVRVHASMGIKFYVPASMTYFLIALLLVGAFWVAQNSPFGHIGEVGESIFLFEKSPLFACIALILLGLATMIIRRDLFSQAVGFLTMENGISAFGVVAAGGLPLLIEVGIITTVVVGILLMTKLTSHMQELYATTDTDLLTELTEE